MINLPQNDYLTIEKDGRTYSCCTLRQKVKHTIGLDYNVSAQKAPPVRENVRGSISSLGASVNLKGESPKCAC